ncbi:hypothetical protein EDD21DRAFT_314646, partial [Dissophora ornata]
MTTTETITANLKVSGLNAKQQDGTGVVALDPWLEPYSDGLRKRYAAYKVWKDRIDAAGGYEKFSRGYERFGFTVSKMGITYREWAPSVKEAFLFGDFNNWSNSSHPMKRDEYGVYEIFLP